MVEKGTRLKLDKPMMDMLVKTLKAGNYVEVACEATGICKATFYGWTKKGKEARAKMEKGKVLNDNEVLFLNFLNKYPKCFLFFHNRLQKHRQSIRIQQVPTGRHRTPCN